MSDVTSVILIFSVQNVPFEFDGEDLIEPINEYLINLYGKGLKDLTNCAGGNKRIESEVFGGAFNYFDLKGFVAQVQAFPWPHPEWVQLLWQEEGQETFTMTTLKNHA